MAARDPWLAAILLAAAGLRLYGLGHGLPFVYNPDEANIMARALSLAQDPNPHYFLYPSFFFYLVFAVMGGLYGFGRMAGWYPDRNAFAARFFEDPTEFYLAARWLGVVASLGTIALTYLLARRHFGKPAARAAALFIAVCFFQVRDSHYLKHDVPAAFLVMVALAAFSRLMERKSLPSYLGVGAAMGAAFATHYYTIFLAPVFLLCHWAAAGLREWRKPVAGALAAAVVFFILSPFVVLNLPVALDHMRTNRQIVVDRSMESGGFLLPSLPSYVSFLAVQGLGILLLALVVVGCFLLIRPGVGCAILWAAFPLCFLGFISYTHFAGRYLNPILPNLAVAGGLTVQAVQRRYGAPAAVLLALGASVQPLYYDWQMNRLFASEDTRTLARKWIIDHLPDREAIALQSYSVPIPQSEESLRESLAANDALDELARRGKYFHLAELSRKERPAYRLYFIGNGDEKDRIYFSYSELNQRHLGPLLSRSVSAVVLRYPPDKAPTEVARLFREVARRGRLEKRFSPFSGAGTGVHPYLDNEDWPPRPGLSRKGPLVEIWSLSDH